MQRTHAISPPPETSALEAPRHDLGALLGVLGTKLFTRECYPETYVAWAVQTGLCEFLETAHDTRIPEISSSTVLNESGVEALLGVLCALGLATAHTSGRYRLTGMAREYLLRGSPFFIGDELKPLRRALPSGYLRARKAGFARIRSRLLMLLPSLRYGSRVRLANQHARNLPACTAAVRTGEFAGFGCVIDIAGGSGTFAIPLAVEQPDVRIVLAELPQALPNIRHVLAKHRMQHRIGLIGMDVFEYPWKLPACDGIFIGNFLHGFDDEACRQICRQSYESLPAGGKLWLHEMLWNPNKDGPLITALWNASLRAVGPGRQRTGQEWMNILAQAGFASPYVVPTSGAFALVAGHKPALDRRV